MLLEERIIPFIVSEKGQRLGWVVVIATCMMFIATLIYTFMSWRDDYVLIHQALPTIHHVAVVNNDAELIMKIPEQHLFGQSAEDTGFLPITNLQMRLTGVMRSSQNNLSRAIIAEAGQPGKVYNIGDMLVSGIRIFAINDDGVVLEHAGRLEKLPLVRNQLAFKGLPQSSFPTINA